MSAIAKTHPLAFFAERFPAAAVFVDGEKVILPPLPEGAQWETSPQKVSLRVAARAVLSQPVEIVFIKKNAASEQQFSIEVGQSSQVCVWERHVSAAQTPAQTQSLTQIFVGENAQVEHTRSFEENSLSQQTVRMEAQVAAHGELTSHVWNWGGRKLAMDFDCALQKAGAHAGLFGLTLGKAAQEVVQRTALDHICDHCTSLEVYKGILSGQSRSSFEGKIVVRPNAQKTDAVQLSKNLLLSEKAWVHTQPQLEIYANDVKCKHGATVGRIAEDSLFYLRSRGIDAATAQALLMRAFAAEMLEKIKSPQLREKLSVQLDLELPKLLETK